MVTRWATHGELSQTNAHRIRCMSGNCTVLVQATVESEVVGVHNGIIELYTELKRKLLKHGYTFYSSQTDTEVSSSWWTTIIKKYNLGPIDAIAKTTVYVRPGSVGP